jgi:hypothetical protein
MKPEEKIDKPHHVTITINGQPFEVHEGNHPVVELKNLAHIPKEDVLCLVKDGKLIDLDDKAHLDIHGGEVFASHKPSGGSSC